MSQCRAQAGSGPEVFAPDPAGVCGRTVGAKTMTTATEASPTGRTEPARATPELLAPAGDWDAMRAAVANGADAVYFGLDGGFNARYRAANFSVEELPRVMDYLHAHNVRGY